MPIRDNSVSYYTMEGLTTCLGFSLIFQVLAVGRINQVLSAQIMTLLLLILIGVSAGFLALRFGRFQLESEYVPVNSLQRIRVFWLILMAMAGATLGVMEVIL